MKNKTFIAFTFIFVGLFIVIMSLTMNFNFARLKSSISEANSDGLTLSITCDKETLKVNETSTCELRINGSTSIAGFEGGITTNSNLSITSFTANTDDFINMNTISTTVEDKAKMISLASAGGHTGNTLLVTISVKAVSEGNGTVTIGNSTNNKLVATLNNDDLTSSKLNGTTQSITVSNGTEPAKSNNANLTAIRVGLGATYRALTPSFSPNVTSYTVNFSDEDKIQNQIIAELEIYKADSKATVVAPSTVNLTSETNVTLGIVVTAEDGTTKKTYNITFNKIDAKSSNNKLSSLSLCYQGDCAVSLNPTFNSDTLQYTSVVSNDIDSIDINVVKADTKATVTGDGNKTLNVGTNNFDITVTAENGAKRIYKLTIEREAPIDDTKSSDNSLKSLSIDGVKLNKAFNKDTLNYEASSATVLNKINVKATANDSKATVTGAGEINVVEGKTTITIKVTAENGSIKIYSIVFNNGTSVDPECNMVLSSSVYQIDNEGLIVGAVDKDHSDETIKSNLKTDCGTISVKDEKVTITKDSKVKVYSINRVFYAKTGVKIIKYAIIIGCLCIVIGGLMLTTVYMNKKKNKE